MKHRLKRLETIEDGKHETNVYNVKVPTFSSVIHWEISLFRAVALQR